MPPAVSESRRETARSNGVKSIASSSNKGGPGSGSSPADTFAPGRNAVGKAAPHNAALHETNAKKGQKIEFNPDAIGSRTGSSLRDAVSPVRKSPQPVDNTKGIGMERPPSTRAVSPVIYDLPRDKQGNFSKIMFLNPLERKYECPVCHDFMRYPVQFEECGHRVCSSCLQDLLKVSPKCPIDQKPIDKDHTFPDSAISREIGGLKCKCSLSTLGCQWVGEVRGVFGHEEAECRFVLMDCPNKCGVTFERRFLDRHISDECSKRSMHCAHCSDIIAAREAEQHENECPAVELLCPNECGQKMRRDQVEKHVNDDCGANKVHCTYYEAGCLHMCQRSDLKKHLRTEALNHLDLVNQLLLETRKLVGKHQNFVGGSTDFLQNLGASGYTWDEKYLSEGLSVEKAVGSQLLWKLDGINEKKTQAIKGEKITQYSKQFYTGPHGYKLIAATCLNGTGQGQGQYLPVYIFICKGEWDTLLPWPFKAEVTITLLDTKPDVAARQDVTYSLKPDPEDASVKDALVRPVKERNPYFGINRFAPLSVLDPNKSSYNDHDSIYIQIVISQDEIPAL